MEPIKLEYKTYEQLKEELGSEYDTAMYEINMSALHEIERLESIIYKAVKFLRENACIDKDVEYFCSDLRYDDCKKLLNILKGSDK